MKRIMNTGCRWLSLLFILAFICSLAYTQDEPGFDLLIVNGRVMDGTGNPWFYADIGIENGRIKAIERTLKRSGAKKIIDAEGKYVVPGFIDVHTHAYDSIATGKEWAGKNEQRYCAPNFVSQGVTTLVSNQCGGGPLSIAKQRDALASHGIGPNVMLLIGHNTIRRHVLGKDFQRTATVEEIRRMRELVRQAMKDGAFGLSTGLEYVPSIWSDTEELVALVEEIVPHTGVFFVHERGSGVNPMWYLPSQHPPGQPGLLDSIVETIEVGERTGAEVVATHIKARGSNFWGSSKAAIHLIERARARGVDIWADLYPYNTTGSDGRVVLVPRWALGKKPKETLAENLSDPEKEKDIRRDTAYEISRRGSAENIIVLKYPDESYQGKTLAELAHSNGLSAVDMVFKLQMEGFNQPGGGILRGFSLSEIDVEAYSAQTWVATASDASIALPNDGFVHPRFYGTFPRKIRHYALTRGVISLEHAIRSSTSLPAQIMGLCDRGMLREGYRADVVIFDLDEIRDAATVFEPHQHAEGIAYVFVNGVAVVEKGELTWERPGNVLSR
jgi:N-acyl-D-amino-acid deacylase